MRSKIKDRLMYLYNKYVKEIKAPTKLQKAIMEKYYEKVSKNSRESLENGSEKLQKRKHGQKGPSDNTSAIQAQYKVGGKSAKSAESAKQIFKSARVPECHDKN